MQERNKSLPNCCFAVDPQAPDRDLEGRPAASDLAAKSGAIKPADRPVRASDAEFFAAIFETIY